MAETIIVKPTEQAPIQVGGGNSGNLIQVTTDIDYTRVEGMINKKIGNIDFSVIEQALSETAKETTLNTAKEEILTAVNKSNGGAAQAKAYYDSNTGNLTFENIELTIE